MQNCYVYLSSSSQNRPGNRVNTTERLAALRREMSSAGVEGYIVLLTDEHGVNTGSNTLRYSIMPL